MLDQIEMDVLSCMQVGGAWWHTQHLAKNEKPEWESSQPTRK